MGNVVLNITQGFALAALIPCALVIIYLLSSAKKYSLVVIPIIYFISLAANFLMPLLDLFPGYSYLNTMRLLAGFISNMLPEMSFLLILQLISGKIPEWPYFLILTVPLVGGGPFSYLYFSGYSQVCLSDDNCFVPEKLMHIYRSVSGAFVFLLLIFMMGRNSDIRNYSRKKLSMSRIHIYWLVISLIILNLFMLAVNLFQANFGLKNNNAQFIEIMIKVAFVYMVLSSIFRVSSENFSLSPIRIFGRREHTLANEIETLMDSENIYRNVGFSRKKLAEKLDVNESTLSKVINWKFNKSFRRLINEYRIDEAKKLLEETNKPVTVIAYDVGFTSITSFNRVFKKIVGKSATEFRVKKTG